MNIHSVIGTRPAPAPDGGRRAAVLAAALACFEEGTYAGTPMPAVAARAGTGVGTIYRYFPSKEALANAVFRAAKADLLGSVRAALADLPAEGRADVRAQFHGWWQGMARFATRSPEAFAFLEHQQHAAYLDADSRALAADLDQAAVAVIRAGQAAGAVRAGEPAVLMALVLGALVGLTRLARDRGQPLRADELDLAETAVWDLLHDDQEST